MFKWTFAGLDSLSPAALYEALVLRSAVFVVEQNCVFQDADGLDRLTWHLLGHDEAGVLQVYARLVPPKAKSAGQMNPMIGRVVTAPTARGHGAGRALMQQALLECAKLWPNLPIDIQAQLYLQDFYASLGFVPTSEVYDEDGIDHIDMKREAV